MMPNADHELPPSNLCPSNLYPFDQWLAGRGLSRTTGYRYRRAGIIEVVEIYGRLYITKEQISRFEARAMNGEFRRRAESPI